LPVLGFLSPPSNFPAVIFEDTRPCVPFPPVLFFFFLPPMFQIFPPKFSALKGKPALILLSEIFFSLPEFSQAFATVSEKESRVHYLERSPHSLLSLETGLVLGSQRACLLCSMFPFLKQSSSGRLRDSKLLRDTFPPSVFLFSARREYAD